jgi:4-hydroxythreonine-4-phosphate dehydrogenase
MHDSSRLIITPGEPAGIGPDIVLQNAQHPSSIPGLVIADRDLLIGRAKQLGLDIKLVDYDADPDFKQNGNGKLHVKHVSLAKPARAGQLNPENSPYVLKTLDAAVDLCLQNSPKTRYALVTGPVHKGIINDAGIPFTGHTEYLAKLAGIDLPVMMLATDGLRIALATTHLPLTKVSENITKPLLTNVIKILHKDLISKFAITNPRIIVCGLNPHAGESGHLGDEEINVIEPVLKQLRQQGMDLLGPMPADTAFTQDKIQQTDAYLAMYHDQGLPVLKHVGFGKAINITLGLPFIRTSVDHGTALELAGSGKADCTSLAMACKAAQELINNQAQVND